MPVQTTPHLVCYILRMHRTHAHQTDSMCTGYLVLAGVPTSVVDKVKEFFLCLFCFRSPLSLGRRERVYMGFIPQVCL